MGDNRGDPAGADRNTCSGDVSRAGPDVRLWRGGDIGLGLSNPGEEQHGNMTGGENGSDGDGFEETHGWLLTLKRGLCGSVVGRGEARLASPLLE